jgi:hypothetical protein
MGLANNMDVAGSGASRASNSATGALRRQSSDGEGAVTPLDEAVLSDAVHEARNQFHKLYYCAELVRSAAGSEGESELRAAAEILERALQALEQVTTGTLEYVRPISLERVRMDAADVGVAIEAVMRADATAGLTARTDESVAGAAVVIDPGRFSAAVRVVALRLGESTRAAGGDGVLEVALRRGSRAGSDVLEIRIGASGGSPDDSAGRGRLVDWAIAEKVLVAHGGGLERGSDGGEVSACTLWLPLVDEHGN